MKEKAKNKFGFLLNLYRSYMGLMLTKIQKRFADSLILFKANISKVNEDGVLLVQILTDYEYTVKFAAASKVLAEQNNLKVYFYDPNWTSWIGWRKKRNKLSSYLFKSRIEKIYDSFGGKVIFNTDDKYHDQPFIQKKLSEIKKNLLNVEDLLNLKFDDIIVGDLIYDSYLRYFHQPTIEDLNKDLFLLIEVGLNIFYNFTEFLEKNKIKILLNLYTSYIDHGITARICLNKQIRVFTLGSESYIIQEASKDFPYHHVNHTLFSPHKNLNENQLNLAKEKLVIRFSGKIDSTMSYMRQSAYANTPINEKLKKQFAEKVRNIIIYTHDFYDSPHINRMLQFPDFYQYLKQTLQALTNLEDTNVFIKTHPNGIKGTKEKTMELVNSFNKKHFHILDESVSNLHIIELKPTLIATVRGTVGLEMAYFEIPTIALFDNLYANFNFVHTCLTKENYFAILKGEEYPNIDFDKQKIYSYYYQVYLENAITKEGNIMSILSSFKGNTSSDAYLDYLMSSSYIERREKMIEYYLNSIKK